MNDNKIFSKYDFNEEYKCSNKCSSKGFTKLMYLIYRMKTIDNGFTVLKNYLINNLHEINFKNNKNWNALMIAVRNSNNYSDLCVVKLLLDNGANIDDRGFNNCTALMFAVVNVDNDSSIETVKLLLYYNASVNLFDNEGMTALMLSVFSAELNTMQLLLINGSDPNIKNNDGETILMSEIMTQSKININRIKSLLISGADPNSRNIDNRTCLMMALIKTDNDENLELIKLLLNNGANPNLSDEPTNYTCLCYGLNCAENNPLTIKLMLDYGADYKKIKQTKILNSLTSNNPVYIQINNFIMQIEHHRLCMKKIIKNIPLRSFVICLSPDSFRIKCLAVRDDFLRGKTNYQSLLKQNSALITYFGITDNDSLKIKISDYYSFLP